MSVPSIIERLLPLESATSCAIEDFNGPTEDLLSQGLIRMDDGKVTLTKAGVWYIAGHRTQTEPDRPVLRITVASELEAADRARRKAPPMKETSEDRGVASNAYAVTADELRQFIERLEQMDAEKADIARQQKELAAEAKGRGYQPKIMRKIISIRRRKPEDVAEEDAILDMYKAALGMA